MTGLTPAFSSSDASSGSVSCAWRSGAAGAAGTCGLYRGFYGPGGGLGFDGLFLERTTNETQGRFTSVLPLFVSLIENLNIRVYPAALDLDLQPGGTGVIGRARVEVLSEDAESTTNLFV